MILDLVIMRDKKSLSVRLPGVRTYYFNKSFLEIYMEDGTKCFFKLTTVLVVREAQHAEH